MKRRIAINILVFAVATSAMVFWAIRNIVSVDVVNNPYAMSAEFPSAVGIGKNAQVTYLGVPIGIVTGVERIDGGIRADLSIERDRRIPMGSSANVQRKSAIGEPIIDFRPPIGYSRSGGSPSIPTDGTGKIPMTDTTVPLEFDELLKSANSLIASIPPDAVATLLREASIGLKGNAESLRGLADASETLGNTFLEKDAAIRRLASNNTALTQLLARKGPTIDATLQDLKALADTLATAKADTNRLLDDGSRNLDELDALVTGIRPNIDCSLRVLMQVMDVTTRPQDLRELQVLFDTGPKAFAGLYDALDIEPDGAWIRVGLVSQMNNPPPAYTPTRVEPATRAVPACTAQLAGIPATSSYRPAGTAAAGITGALPATGRDDAIGLGGLLIALALVARLVIRSEPGAGSDDA